MNIIDNIKNRAKSNKKTIILPETMDIRVLEAARRIVDEGFANIILLGNKDNILKLIPDYDFTNITLIDPLEDENHNVYIEEFYNLRKEKGMTLENAEELLLNDYMYYACMMIKLGKADGAVSGACHSSANTLRPALQIIKTAPGVEVVSSFFLMIVPDCKFGYNGIFVFADCGLIQNPTSEELATIAASSANSFKQLVLEEPIVAMLSHSTLGSSKHADVDKVVAAVELAKNKYPQYLIAGELQLDTAIVPDIAKEKAPNNNLAGKANVLIFPDLDAGNIGYKLVQRLVKAEAYGPITQGIAAPVNDLSRGCSVDDIIGAVAITALQAQK